jgi:1-acyl-sn-glycerol-3-phosphate acyltransferase
MIGVFGAKPLIQSCSVARPYRRWESLLDRLVDDEVAERIDRLEIRVNEYGYDRWGASPAAAKRMLTFVSWLYRRYFRVEVQGLERVPPGAVLLVGNHSAQLAYDGMLVCAAFVLEAEPPRFVRAMIERFFAEPPFVNMVMARLGQLVGIPENAKRLLLEEQSAVLVFPEGERGGGKVWRDRYQIMGFGQGFLRLAMETKAPIVPFAFIGGEEMVPSFSRMKPLARLLGVPYAPLTPTILPLPLPAKVSILFGEPMRFDGTGTEEDEVVVPLVRQVEKSVKSLIDSGLSRRKGVFFG